MARTTTGKRSVGRDGALHVHGKASNGEGSIYRDSDGAWRATYSVPGEARPRRVRGKTREEAIARRTVKLEELSQIQSSTFHRDATVAELAAWWLGVVARHRVRPSTLGTYGQRVERITNTIGQLPARGSGRGDAGSRGHEVLESAHGTPRTPPGDPPWPARGCARHRVCFGVLGWWSHPAHHHVHRGTADGGGAGDRAGTHHHRPGGTRSPRRRRGTRVGARHPDGRAGVDHRRRAPHRAAGRRRVQPHLPAHAGRHALVPARRRRRGHPRSAAPHRSRARSAGTRAVGGARQPRRRRAGLGPAARRRHRHHRHRPDDHVDRARRRKHHDGGTGRVPVGTAPRVRPDRRQVPSAPPAGVQGLAQVQAQPAADAGGAGDQLGARRCRRHGLVVPGDVDRPHQHRVGVPHPGVPAAVEDRAGRRDHPDRVRPRAVPLRAGRVESRRGLPPLAGGRQRPLRGIRPVRHQLPATRPLRPAGSVVHEGRRTARRQDVHGVAAVRVVPSVRRRRLCGGEGRLRRRADGRCRRGRPHRRLAAGGRPRRSDVPRHLVGQRSAFHHLPREGVDDELADVAAGGAARQPRFAGRARRGHLLGEGQQVVQPAADGGHHGPKVGLVLVLANDGPLLTYSATGTVAIAEGDTRKFCFDESGCKCPSGFTAGAQQMDGRDMVFSFAAQQLQGTSDVIAVPWDEKKFCSEPEKEIGQHNGDPHLRSFDGQAFDVMAPGEFVAARDDRGGFEVQVRNEVMNGHGTGTSVVALDAGTHHIVFGGDLAAPGATTLAVDGKAADGSATIDVGDVTVEPAEDNNWTATWPDGSFVELHWNHGWFVSVALDTSRAPHVTGLLGTPNGDMRDDLVLSDGSHVDPGDRKALDHDYATQWYVEPKESLFDYGPGETTFTFRVTPPSPPSIDTEVVSTCAAGMPAIATKAELDACAYDVAVTGDDSFVGIYSQVVTDRVAADPVAAELIARVAKPSGGPVASGSSTTLSGTLASDSLGAQGVVDQLTGTIEVSEGSIILGQAQLCAPGRDITMRVTLRDTDHFNEVHLCDPYGFNQTLHDTDEVVPGEAALWASAGGTYDVRVSTNSDQPLVTTVTVSTDPDPTVVDAKTLVSKGYSGTLSGRADTVVLLMNTGDQSVTWNATGMDKACGDAQYGTDPLGGGELMVIGVCGHTDVVDALPTGDLTVPFIIYAHTDDPVDVTFLP